MVSNLSSFFIPGLVSLPNCFVVLLEVAAVFAIGYETWRTIVSSQRVDSLEGVVQGREVEPARFVAVYPNFRYIKQI